MDKYNYLIHEPFEMYAKGHTRVVPYLIRLVFHVPVTIYRHMALYLKHFKSISPEVGVELQNRVGIRRFLSMDGQ